MNRKPVSCPPFPALLQIRGGEGEQPVVHAERLLAQGRVVVLHGLVRRLESNLDFTGVVLAGLVLHVEHGTIAMLDCRKSDALRAGAARAPAAMPAFTECRGVPPRRRGCCWAGLPGVRPPRRRPGWAESRT